MYTTRGGETVVITDGTLQVSRVVTECKGVWRWQDAYRVAYYGVRFSHSQRHKGRAYFTSLGWGAKRSRPQMKRLGLWDREHGSLHNRPVPAELLQALAQLEELTGVPVAVVPRPRDTAAGVAAN